jgi:hypothetical protein
LPPDLAVLVQGVQGQDLRFTLGDVEALPRLRGALGTLDRVAVLLPVLAFLLAALVIVVARGRAIALAAVGGGASIAGAIGLAAAPLLSGLVAGAGGSDLVGLVASVTIRSLTRPLVDSSLVLLAAGFVVVVVGLALRALLPRRDRDDVYPASGDPYATAYDRSAPYARSDPYGESSPYEERRSPYDR